MKPCKSCNGTGKGTYHKQECYSCDGKGHFAALDVDSIVTAIIGRKGLKSKRPDDSRAYYVWRMARFHGGKDVTLPMMASLDVRGDPYRNELDAISEHVAKKVFGTDMAGAHRWGRALGMISQDMPGLPDSAYSGGKVADENKPEEEALELH
jgi:hypothetical protein